MELTETQYARIEPCLPRQRGNVSMPNLQVLNAILYVAEQGCKWRGLPKRFGNWHTIYTRMNRWSKNGVLDRVFEHLQRAQLIRIKLEAVSLDSTVVKVHPDGTGARKKRPPSHRQVPRRVDHQDSSGCRGCSHGTDVRALARPGPRQPGRPKAPGQHGAAGCQCGLGDGPRVPGATKLTNWRWTWGSHPWCRRSRLGRTRGSTTGRCTSDATRSSVCSAG